MERHHTDPDVRPAPVTRNSDGWQRRLAILVAGGLLLVGLLAAASFVPSLYREPRLVYPSSVQATMEASAEVETLRRESAGRRPISDEVLEDLLKAYGLEGCQVAKKYGALCQDGTVTRTGLLDDDELGQVCSDHGGVAEWIECR
ncbi:MAG TPA: hypothetical protein VFR15_19065 [Chloroflexia bacterium]|nr:hypothetical protein [Chloroflexia bacterium]